MMRKLILGVSLLLLTVMVSNAQILRIYPFKVKIEMEANESLFALQEDSTYTIQEKSKSYVYYEPDSSWYFGPTVGVSMLTVYSNGDFGVVSTPSVGYGIHTLRGSDGDYNLSLSLFTGADFTSEEDYLNIPVELVLGSTIIENYGIYLGFGPQFGIGTGSNSNKVDWMFGIKFGVDL